MNKEQPSTPPRDAISKVGEIVQTLCSVRDAIYDATGSALLAGEKCHAADKQTIYQRLCTAGSEVTAAIDLVQEHDIDLRSKLAIAERATVSEKALTVDPDMLAALRDYSQQDHDGVFCGVSRQALEQAIAILAQLPEATK